MLYDVFVFTVVAASVAVLVGMLCFLVGMLYGSSGCPTFRSWIMEEISFRKEEKAFLKENPYCTKCGQNGKRVKARCVYRRIYMNDTSPVPLCYDCLNEELGNRDCRNV